MPAFRVHLLWIGLYTLVAVACSWPLPLHLHTHLTGPPSGDAGIYVWNVWVFHHEVVVQQTSPLTTRTVMALAPAVDLTLHNYTIFPNLLALPLLAWLPLVTTVNVVYLAMLVLTAWCTALLARAVGCGRWESWLAGFAFAWSPVLVARSAAHFSMLAAAPLPLVLYWMVRGQGTGQLRYAVAIGATLAWAVFCDVYYAVYGVLLVGAWTIARSVQVTRAASAEHRLGWLRFVLDALIVIAAAFVTVVAVKGGLLEVAGLRVSMRSLYTPMLVLTTLVVMRLLMAWRPRVRLTARPRLAAAGVLAAGLLTMALGMGPVLLAYGGRLLDGAIENPGVYWRSSPPGVDLLAFVMPNPSHPLFGRPFHDWIVARRPDGFAELTGALSLVALAVIAVAWRVAGWRPARRWWWMALGFAALAVGPFVHVAGINTYVPGPWAILRYLPVIGLARSPSRFAVVVSLIVAVLLAMALTALAARWPARRRWLLGGVTLLLFAELSPAPRVLYDATAPPVIERIAADDRPDVRVLVVPFGLRDGTSSVGNFDPLTQYYQTVHGKRLIGGYLSRVTTDQKRFHRSFPVLHALFTLSEGKPLGPDDRARAFASRDRFLAAARLGYVVVDDAAVTPELRALVLALFDLRHVESGGGLSLYVPGRGPYADGEVADAVTGGEAAITPVAQSAAARLPLR